MQRHSRVPCTPVGVVPVAGAGCGTLQGGSPLKPATASSPATLEPSAGVAADLVPRPRLLVSPFPPSPPSGSAASLGPSAVGGFAPPPPSPFRAVEPAASSAEGVLPPRPCRPPLCPPRGLSPALGLLPRLGPGGSSIALALPALAHRRFRHPQLGGRNGRITSDNVATHEDVPVAGS